MCHKNQKRPPIRPSSAIGPQNKSREGAKPKGIIALRAKSSLASDRQSQLEVENVWYPASKRSIKKRDVKKGHARMS